MITPSFDQFRKGYEEGKNQVLFAKIPADLETPVSLFLKLANNRKNCFLLESVTGGEDRGRYSILGMDPDLIWQCDGNSSFVTWMDCFDQIPSHTPETKDPFLSLRSLIKASSIDLPSHLPASSSGLFGYLSYDMVRLVENLPQNNPDTIGTPDAILLRPSLIAVLDGVLDELNLVCPVWYNENIEADIAYQTGIERLEKTLDTLQNITFNYSSGPTKEGTSAKLVNEILKEEFLAMIRKAKNYIREGDIFQVVPSQRWIKDFPHPPISLYRALRRTNPSPYMFYFNFGEFQVIGASPEILVKVEGKEIIIRPLAGTRPRGQTPEEDRELSEDLLADEKEIAEHLMLLDLGRNDVGRVSKIGTVNPTEQFQIEKYSHVMHIVSNVVGELSEGEDALSALMAGLPAGTVSGAPKVRAMEIIDELEISKRGVYAGGVGYFSSNGDMDMCIALRTSVIKNNKLYIQAGVGVVYDSDPETEWQETISKSMALQKAAEAAPQFIPEINK